MKPADFLSDIVRPNVSDLKAEFGNMRRAFNAVAALDALAAHLYNWCKDHAPGEISGVPNDNLYRDRLAQENADFALLRDVAKANKHVYLTRGNPQVTGAGQVSREQLGWGRARFGEGRFGSPAQVVVNTNSGDTRVVEAIVDRALAFLEGEMNRLGAA